MSSSFLFSNIYVYSLEDLKSGWQISRKSATEMDTHIPAGLGATITVCTVIPIAQFYYGNLLTDTSSCSSSYPLSMALLIVNTVWRRSATMTSALSSSRDVIVAPPPPSLALPRVFQSGLAVGQDLARTFTVLASFVLDCHIFSFNSSSRQFSKTISHQSKTVIVEKVERQLVVLILSNIWTECHALSRILCQGKIQSSLVLCRVFLT